MIGTIRKHSKWLWILIAGLTIISFVYFMSVPAGTRGGGGTVRGNSYGTIYGHRITAQDFARAQGEFYLYHWMRYQQWPDRAGMSREDMARETYIRLMLTQKAAKLGIEVDDATVAKAAGELLGSLGRNGQPVPMQQFAQQILTPAGLSVADFQNFLRAELTVQQLVQALGLSGALVTPQEAGLLYDREHQEVSAQAVFFAASNYLSQVAITPGAVAQFYTNNMAYYREPDRVSVSYVFYDVTNFLAQSQTEWEKTNFTENIEAAYRQFGKEQFPEAKTPDEAKAKIRELLIRDRALRIARQQANDFAAALFAVEPVKPENLTALAKQKGLSVRTTAPFAANYGPEDFSAPTAFTKAAFQLTADEPFAGPVLGPDGIYVLTLAGSLPSAVPPLEQIHARVTQDFQGQEAIILAQRAGTNFYHQLSVQMAAGKTFAQAAVGAGHAPLALAPFSLSSTDVPEAGDHATAGQLKQAAFTTPVGHTSNFTPDRDGGFVLYVQEMLPVDQAKKTADLPQFTTQVRRSRQSEAFQLWLTGEANRELRDTPVYTQIVESQKRQS